MRRPVPVSPERRTGVRLLLTSFFCVMLFTRIKRFEVLWELVERGLKPNSGKDAENKEKGVLIVDNNDTRRIRDEGNHVIRLV
jgi:hypothetical protein